jgi:UDP-glucose 4-epimerase
VADSVLVTGAAGFIGVPLVRELLRQGHSVTAVDNFRLGSREGLAALGDSDRLSVIGADITDRAALVRAVARAVPSRVFHLAALHFIPYCETHPQETVEVNVIGLLNLLEALAEQPARVIFMSTGDVYLPSEKAHSETDPAAAINVYGASKLWGEWILRNWLLRHEAQSAVIVRLFNTYGPGETNPHVIPGIMHALVDGAPPRLGNLASKRDFIYVDDVASVLADLMWLDRPPELVNVAAGRSASVEEVLTEIGQIRGNEVAFEVDPARFRKSDRPNLEADISVLMASLPEFSPRPLAAGLRCLLAHHRLVAETA